MKISYSIITRIRVFLNVDFFPSVLAFRSHVNGVFGNQKRSLSKTVPVVEFLEYANLSFSCGGTEAEVFEYSDVIHHLHV